MISTHALRRSLVEVGRAVRRPEELATRWRDRADGDGPEALVFGVLLVNAVVGLLVYGLVNRMPEGVGPMLHGAVTTPAAAGLAWSAALPALYVFNRALGSRLDVSTHVLAALVACSFGALAMLAGVPVNWFFGLALPGEPVVYALVNLAIFSGVGVAMADVFARTMRALEPDRSIGYACFWLALVGVIGSQLFVLLDVFVS